MPRPYPAAIDRAAAQRGAVYVEFLVAFIPILIFFLGMLQLALGFAAKLVVRHAAVKAERSAVVVLEDDPKRYDKSPRGQVTYKGSSGQKSQSSLGDVASKIGVGGDTGSLMSFGGSEGDARINAIRRAAYMPLAALAPPLSQLAAAFHIGGSGLASDVGNGGRFLAGLFLYNRAAAMVTLRDDAGKVITSIPADGNITVHVTYLFYCGIPIANAIICRSATDLVSFAADAVRDITDRVRDGDIVGAKNAAQGLGKQVSSARDDFNTLKAELAWAESPWLLAPLALTGAHFLVLQAEATLPNQGACYYPGSSCYSPK